MDTSSHKFIGIDPFAINESFTYSILDEDCRLVQLGEGNLSDIPGLISQNMQIYIAVNGPRRINMELVKQLLVEKGSLPGQLRGCDLRVAEQSIRDKGINISSTPSKEELCPEWMSLSFSIFAELKKIDFVPFPSSDSSRQLMETHAHSFYYSKIGDKPLSKSTIEGKLQRQLALFDSGVGIHNPMRFYEEITRYKLLKGLLPMEIIYTSEQLDAISASFTAYLAANQPEKIEMVGDKEEGQIIIPI